jgi:hypothetical protein
MFSLFLRKSSVCAALILLLFSCRQPIDLDTNRTVVPTNLPEITDFSPKASSGGTRVTIIGKNFVNVQKVMLDTLQLDSVIVESRTRLSARLPWLPYNTLRGVFTLSVTTKLGTAQAPDGFVREFGIAAGKVTLHNQILDSTLFYLSKPLDNFTTIGHLTAQGFPKGWYFVYFRDDPQGRFTKETVVRPFKSGYRFFPTERRILQGNGIIGGQDFEATPLSSEGLPSVTSISPTMGTSYGWKNNGTTIVLHGTGFSRVQKVVIGIPYPSSNLTNPTVTTLCYTEAKEIMINSNSQITVTLPQLDGTKAIPGRTYTNCQIYLLLDEGSIVVPQRISIIYL